VSRTESQLQEVASTLRKLSGLAIVAAGDVSRPEDVTRIISTAVAEYGSVNVLVNAAGIHGPIARLWESDIESWISAVQVNLIGTFLCCRAAIPHMILRKNGKIINFSGGGATAASPYFSAYGASKAAIVRLTETLAVELNDFNVQVNAIAPGVVDTQIHEDVLAASNLPRELLEPLRRLKERGEGGVPAELPAALAVFLASPAAGVLSGKLVAAPHDNWQQWNAERVQQLMGSSWLSLRRMDAFTLKPLVELISS
jgi:NAD(P)-dependent dehydrogenase (short-subunit alcohol dehydrogenase family)